MDERTRAATSDDDLYHFIAYTSVQGVLYEIDGLQPAPISHGPCDDSDFAQKVIPVLQRRIERYPSNEIRFNLLAMIRDPRVHAREIGDLETLEREEARRESWMWENELRRHNFVGFIHEIAKEVVRSKVGEADGVERWIDAAKEKSKQRLEARKKSQGDEDIQMS